MTNSLKAAGWTFLFSFLTLFITSAVGWLGDVLEWATGQGVTPFPDVSVLGYFFAAAVVSAMIGFLNWAVRFVQEKAQIGSVPTYGPPVESPKL